MTDEQRREEARDAARAKLLEELAAADARRMRLREEMRQRQLRLAKEGRSRLEGAEAKVPRDPEGK